MIHWFRLQREETHQWLITDSTSDEATSKRWNLIIQVLLDAVVLLQERIRMVERKVIKVRSSFLIPFTEGRTVSGENECKKCLSEISASNFLGLLSLSFSAVGSFKWLLLTEDILNCFAYMQKWVSLQRVLPFGVFPWERTGLDLRHHFAISTYREKFTFTLSINLLVYSI